MPLFCLLALVCATGARGQPARRAGKPTAEQAAGQAGRVAREAAGPLPTEAELQGHYAVLEKAIRSMRRDRFEPEAVIEAVGREPEGLLAWVRDGTDLVPYRGALRGAAGVLMDRAGNSLDRSLLLAELLRAAGYEARLANAVLPAEAARQLAAAAGKGRRHAAPDPDDKPTAEALKARQRVERLAAQVLDALGPATFDKGGDVAAADLADHWWVQRKDATGAWVDMDPAFAAPGETPAKPARTVAYSAGDAKFPLGANDCHQVEFRAVIEVWRGGRLQTERVLRHTMRPAEILGRPVRFGHFLGGALKEEHFRDEPAAREALRSALTRQELYLPVLRVGDRVVTEASFTTTGQVDRHPKIDPAGMLAKGSSQVLGGLGGGLAGDEPQQQHPGVLTAEWIEYEVRAPGRKPLTVRRPVFDLIGPAARAAGVKEEPKPGDAEKLLRAGRLVGDTRILLQPCDLPPSFYFHGVGRRHLKDRPVWLAVARGEADTPEKFARSMARLSLWDEVTPGFALLREGINPAPGRTFIDLPNIIHHRTWFEATPKGGLALRQGMDLALTSTAGQGPGGAREARVVQGVADTLAEHLVLGPDAVAAENTAAAFEASMNGTAPVVVRPRDAARAQALAKLNLPPDTLARARADLEGGHVLVLAAAGPGRWAWWRVDERTGQTVGVTDGGYHSAITEKADLEAEAQAITGNTMRVKDLKNLRPDQIRDLAKGDRFNMVELRQISEEAQVLAGKLSRFMNIKG